MIGRGGKIRTCDLSVPNRALYQAEPRPELSSVSYKKHTQVPNSTGEKLIGQVKARKIRLNIELFSRKPSLDDLFAA